MTAEAIQEVIRWHLIAGIMDMFFWAVAIGISVWLFRTAFRKTNDHEVFWMAAFLLSIITLGLSIGFWIALQSVIKTQIAPGAFMIEYLSGQLKPE